MKPPQGSCVHFSLSTGTTSMCPIRRYGMKSSWAPCHRWDKEHR
ncbi:hypothetical protein E2C01_092085 [Portunus trituberculatus]|uniref:Uncharacterized protein n=1 Tax=Portunus trituberculatus TaxID=210409 RepID=A0A5B7JUJ7_PORTR|nr:hypothetical protein [Portunus trituberculatus]